MLKPNKQLLQAMASLDGNVHYEVIKSWIQQSSAELARQTIMDSALDDGKHRVLQGKAFNCFEIKVVLEQAADRLRKILDEEKKEVSRNG